MHKRDICLYVLHKSVYSCTYLKKYANCMLRNNALFDLSMWLEIALEFTMFQFLEHYVCLPKDFGSDLIPCKAA